MTSFPRLIISHAQGGTKTAVYLYCFYLFISLFNDYKHMYAQYRRVCIYNTI